jgi:NAD(P)-dependent dehydrogenase (short-subunit alcohol dehydrogenase family)
MTTPLVALITAGTAGLGAATARLFARNGIRVVVNYANNAERAENLVKELRSI